MTTKQKLTGAALGLVMVLLVLLSLALWLVPPILFAAFVVPTFGLGGVASFLIGFVSFFLWGALLAALAK